jgi:hypothetical protein
MFAPATDNGPCAPGGPLSGPRPGLPVPAPVAPPGQLLQQRPEQQEQHHRVRRSSRATSGELPKGLAAHTSDLVERTPRAHPEGLSATECADAGAGRR